MQYIPCNSALLAQEALFPNFSAGATRAPAQLLPPWGKATVRNTYVFQVRPTPLKKIEEKHIFRFCLHFLMKVYHI